MGDLQPGTMRVKAPLPDAAAAAAPVEIVVKLRKNSQAAATMERSRKDDKAKGKRLDGEHELRAIMDRHAVKSSEAVFNRTKRDDAAEMARAKDNKETQRDKLFRWCRLQLPAGTDPTQAIADLKANPAVESAEPVCEYKLSDTGLPNGTTDPKLPQQWHHTAIKAQQTWTYLQSQGLPAGGARDVVVAVIDTGVDYNHEDLVANMWTNPREIPGNGIDDDGNGFIDDIHGCSVTSDSRSHSGDPIDLHGHGTHCAGIIASTAFNSKGGVGVAFNVQIMAVRAAQSSGVLTNTDVAEGILYAVDNGAEVINMSFGGYQRSQVMEEALAMALNQAVLVAAAGNDTRDAKDFPSYPAALPYVLGVMATDTKGKLTWFSNYDTTGKIYTIRAPGEGILSTLPGNQYAAWDGTSMAAPIVSGIAALTRSYYSNRNVYSSRFVMGALSGATSLDALGNPTGVSAFKAVTELPPPAVVLLDRWLFDDKAISVKNDADGRVDSGETINLAIEAKNNSGKAKNVVATLRAAVRLPNDLYVDDPYVSFVTNTVNLGDIGSFNTSDNGFIRDPSGVITGVEHPFVFQVSSDCPNDHVIPFEITFTYLDGWDPDNTTPFTQVERFEFIVQRGKNLPTVIDSDMVLTADEYWIVGGPVLIEPGATLTVMPGTQIQWGAISDDPYNPGPQTGNMIVRGNLRIEGTCEQPVSMFPSTLVGGQNVTIRIEGGTADMAYARVRNAYIDNFRIIDHCFFDADLSGISSFGADLVTNSIFHKLRGPYVVMWASSFECCLFDSPWLTYWVGGPYISNCTFLQDNENNRPMILNAPVSTETSIHNAFLSKYWDPNVNTWMRVRAGSGYSSAMNFNYWGTTSTTLIDHMIVDYYDNFNSARVDYKPAPTHGYTTTYPFVEQVLINGTPVDSIPRLSTGRADFTVTFNRDMDMTVEPFVTFGPSSPYTDFQVTARDADFQPMASGWLNPRTWQGSAWITPMSGDGYHLMRISGAVAASDPWLVSGYDVGRFRFEVRSMEVAAMTLQANGQEGAIHLQWQQDDFDLLAGYNLYRASSATGPWEKLNTTVIAPGSESYTDLAVAPAVPMYYKFSVLSTDFQESDFSNVAMAAAIDTVVPTITHMAVTTAAPARGMRVTATATDNLRVTAVTVHYRALGGTGDFTAMAAANLTGNTWTATIPGSSVVAPGLEYYLVATDGISEAFSGTPVLPHQVTVSNVPTLASVTPSHGPASGGTAVTLSGMLFEPNISVFFGGVLAGNVQVLSSGQLTCETPAHFPALVDVKVVNPDLTESTLLNAFRFEETGVVVSAPNTSGNFGSQVELAVSASNLVGLRAADLTITWNPAVLTAVSARLGTVTAGWTLSPNLNTAGRAVFSLASASAVSGGGSLVILRFNVIGSPPVSTSLVIDSVSLNDGAMTASRSDGVFTVNGFFDLTGTVRYFKDGAAVPGVAMSLAGAGSFPATTGSNGGFSLTSIPTGSYLLTPSKTNQANGIGAYDASLVLQKAAGLISLSADETRAADVNRNGSVSSMDASYILEQAVGLTQVPFSGAGRIWDFLPDQRTYSLLNTNLTGQDFTAVLLGDVSGNWSPEGAPAPMHIQSGTAAYALIHDAINITDPNTAWLLVKTSQPAIYGLDMSVSYDPKLTLHEVRAGSLGANHAVAFHSPAAGSARIAAACALPVTGEGVMLELRFSGPPANVAVTSVQFDEARVSAVADPALDVFDTDHDGLINTLETDIYHTNPAVADSDGDGRNDGEEVIAGTSPADAASVFALQTVENLPDDAVKLTWSSVPGRTYQVEVSESLADSQWVDACPAITATADLSSTTIPKPPSSTRAFYRIAVSTP